MAMKKASSLTSFMGNAKEAKKIDPDIDLGIPDAFHLDQLDEHKMTANEVVQFYNPEMMGQIFENTQHLVNLLDKAEEGVFSRYLKANSSEDSRNDFDFGHPKTEDNASDDADPFGFGPNKPIFSSTYIKNLKRGTRSHFKSPHFLKNKFGSSPKKEEKRRRLQESTQCQADCNPESRDVPFWQCNCQLLVGYATDITPYDLAVMFAQGYIDQSEDSASFATLTANPNLFDADDGLPSKAKRIQELVSDLNLTFTKPKCDELLQEFHTAKGLEQSVQLSIDEIRDAVQTSIKLLLSEIALKYDGLDRISAGPFSKGGKVDEQVGEGLCTDISYSDEKFGSPSDGLLPEGVYRFRVTSTKSLEEEQLYISAIGLVSSILVYMHCTHSC